MFNKKFTLVSAVLAAALLSGCSERGAEDGYGAGAAPGQAAGSYGADVSYSGDHGDAASYAGEGSTASYSGNTKPAPEEENLFLDTKTVTYKKLAEIPANTTYGEILEILGQTQAFGQPRYRQYVTYDERLIQLHFDSKDDICPYSGTELYDRAFPIVPPEGVSGGHYGVMAIGNLFAGGKGGCAYLLWEDAEIVFEDGSPASEDDLEPETAVLIDYDYALYSAPEQWHCTRIVIPDVKPTPAEAPYEVPRDDCATEIHYPDGVREITLPNGGVETYYPDGAVAYKPPEPDVPADIEEVWGNSTETVYLEELVEIPANTSYREILEKLGNTQAFGQRGYRQYMTEYMRVIPLRFDSMDDLCPYSGKELYERAVPLRYDGEVPEGMMYGVLVMDGSFFTYYRKIDSITYTIDGNYLLTRDAEIVFEDGTPASEDDLKPETAVFVESDYVLESYPEQRHCTKIILLK